MDTIKDWIPNHNPNDILYRERHYSLDTPWDLRNKVVIGRGNEGKIKIGYFDNKGIFRTFLTTHITRDGDYVTAYNEETNEKFVYLMTGFRFATKFTPDAPSMINKTPVHRIWFKHVIDSLEADVSTISDFIERYNWIVEHKSETVVDDFFEKFGYYGINQKSTTDIILEKNKASEEIRKFIYKIEQPKFERSPENQNTKTFDFIRIFISIPSKQEAPDRITFIKQHMKEIVDLTLNKIQTGKRFQNFGVPINILQLETATITKTDQLQFLFGIKQAKESEDNYGTKK